VDIFDEAVLNFWKALQNHKVQYIMIGGYAINLHGYQRFTGDLDIWLKDTLENRIALRKAFISCGIGDYPMIEYMKFVAGWTDFHMINNLRLDILTEMKGLEGYTFDECLQMASIADIEGTSIPFLHINQLIANKKVINRPKDQIDIAALEQIRKLRGDFNNL
jgi:predicted nucleotidyltransferase